MLEFLKRKQPNIQKASPEMITQVTTQLFSEIYVDEKDLSFDDIDKILKDIDVDTAIKKIERAVAGKELIVWSDNEKNRKIVDEIQDRFNDVKFNRIFKYFLRARYYGYSCFEKVYNTDYSLKTLVFIPEKYITYDTLGKKWLIKAGTEEKEIDYKKFLLSIHEWNVAEKTGKSIFTGIQTCFLDKEMFRRQLRGLAKKYGDTIIIFGFDLTENVKKITEKAEKMRKLQGGKSVIGVPMVDGKSLKDNIYVMTLSDLNTEVYTKLEDREKERLIQNILGGTLTMESGNGTGSYSLGQIHQESFDEVVEECCSFITDCLQQLLEFDGLYFGYNPKEFYFKLETKKDRDKEIELEEKEAKNMGLKIDNILKLNQVGIGLTPEYISSSLGIDKKHVIEIEKTVAEFAKKDKKKLLIESVKNTFDKRMRNSEIKLQEFVKNIQKSVKKWLETDILSENLNFDINIMEEMYIKTFLFGYTDSLNQRGNKEFQEEFDPFNMQFNEAINYFAKKAPILYEKLDDITSSVKDTFFYIKRSTELEATKRVLESLKKTLENGGTYQEWKQDISDIADKAGLGEDGWYSNLVYRQNMVNAYQSGRYEQQMEDDEYFSYLLFDGVEDDRQTDFCRTYSGKVYKKSDPIWALIYPPNHFNCRSSVIELGADKIKELGLEILKSNKKELKEIEKEIGDFAKPPTDIKGRKKDIKTKEKKLVQLKLEIAELMEGKR
ncbi:phage minor head protein [Fusobacterium sp.]|uniref:phage portal protein family protein n=1 Tax=Fusobacterium sp. TaxID=68766 RepID=UPI000E9C1C5B|nr:phage minor head protein [Fusobacterium sp.]HBJ80172.1 phage head morphogenesis protein [Fusobacterium sp.]